eukprot:TRINITY_DN3851_c0_g1_i1.p1 TRINITY_DN3851_c0_g1~~TRINITY_DN3851_c0_g1_i1.p1  ORF type:complete len:799 (-),score=178.58 TRINITY_DN3851_c0_g1_i1:489-2885(-)
MTEEPKETSQGVKRKEAPELGEDLPVSPVKKLKETHESDNIPKFVEIKQEPLQIPIVIEPPPIPEPIATSASPKPLDAVIPTPPIITPPTNTEQPIVQQPAPVPRVEQPQNRLLSSDEEKELLAQLQNQEKSNPVLARFRRKLAIRQAKRNQGHEDKIFDMNQLITTYTATTEKKQRRLVQFYPKKQIYAYLKAMPSPKKLKSSSNGTANINIASNGRIGHNNAITIKKEHDPTKKPIGSVMGSGNVGVIRPIIPPTAATGLAVNVKPSTGNNTNVIARQATSTPIGVKVPGSNAISITNQAYITGAAKTPILIPGLKPGTGVLTGNVITNGMLTGGIIKGAGNTPIAVRVQGPGTTQVQAVTVPNAMPKGSIGVMPVQIPKTGTKVITPISAPKLSTQAITAQQFIMNPKMGQGTPVQLKTITPGMTLSAANAKMLAGVVKNPNAVAIPKTGNVVAIAGYPTITTANAKNPTGQVFTVGGRPAMMVPVSAAKLNQAIPNVSKPGTTTASVLSPTGRGTAIAISPSTASSIAAVTGVAPPSGVKGQPMPASIKSVPLMQALAKTSVQSAVPVPTTAVPKQIAIQPKTIAPVPLAPKPTPIAPNVKSPVLTPVTPVISQPVPIPATVVATNPTVNPPTSNTNADTTKPAEASATNTNVTAKSESTTTSPATTTKTTRQTTAKTTTATPAKDTTIQSENKNDADKPSNDKKSPVASSKKEAPPAAKAKETKASAATAKKNNAKNEENEKESEEKEEESNNDNNEDESGSRRRTTRSSAVKAAPASAAPKKGNSKAKKGKK